MFRHRVAAVVAFCLVASLVVAEAGAVGRASLPSGGTDDVWSTPQNILQSFSAEGANLIRLQAGAFDPLVDPLPLPAGFPRIADSMLPPDEAQYWIVQVRGERFGEVISAIEGVRAIRAGVLLDDAYVVRATPAQRVTLAAAPSVRWTGLLQPGWRVRAADARGPGLVDLEGPQDYRVHLFRVEPAKEAAQRALSAIEGVTVVSTGGSVVDLRATRDQLRAIASVPAVEWVSLVPETFLLNDNARWVIDTGVRDLRAATRADRLTGTGQTAAVADTAPNYKPDRNDRAHVGFRDCDASGCKEADFTQASPGTELEQLENVVDHGTDHRKMAAFFDYGGTGPEPHDESSHGTHTAGSVTGDAFTPGVPDGDDGMAPGARLVHQNLGTPSGGLTLPDDIYDMFRQAYRPRNPASVPATSDAEGNVADYANYVATEDARTHNNSWGSALLGLVPTDEQSLAVDQFVWDHEDMVVVVSAGNAGPEAFTVGDPAAAKNHFDSAASANGRQPMVSFDSLASFSSHGPTRDGRFGPTVATPGQIVVSAKGGSEDDYHYAQGTSMSAPVLTGATTLIRQYFWDGYGPAAGTGAAGGAADPARRHNPSAALVKAAAVNGAVRMEGFYTGDDGQLRELDGQWPSAGQGFGLLNLDNSLYFAGDPVNTWYHDVWRGQPDAFPIGSAGQTREYQLTVAAGAPLDVTLVYTDAPNLLPTGTPALVNNLDLTVVGPGGSYVGNNFNSRLDPKVAVAETPAGAAPPDSVNNTERVSIAAPVAGTYTVRVSSGAILDGHQGFALAASGLVSTDNTTFVPGAPRQADQPGAPVISDLTVDGVSSDLAVVRFSTSEPTTARVSVAGAGTTWVDSYNRGPAGFPEYGTVSGETSPRYADRPVLSTDHEVLVTGLDPELHSFTAHATDQAGNRAEVPFAHTPPAHVFQPRAPDEGNLVAAGTPAPPPAPPTNVGWRTMGQMYAADGFLGAFMFRLPEAVDPAAITGAVVELSTGHQWTIPYDEDPIFTVDLLDESVEPAWGTQTYEELHAAPAAARIRPETTVRDGLIKWQYTLSCDDLETFKATLAADGGERQAAFRYDVTDPGIGLLSVEPGFNRRSRGPQYRPRLVLLTGDNPSGATAPCDPGTPAPVIAEVGIHDGATPGSVTVSWRTDVPSDSLVLFREQGTTEFTQVGSPSLTTVHQVQVLGLDPATEYEFGVRSAACNGATTTADNLGAGWDFFYPPVPQQEVATFWFHGGPADQAAKEAAFADVTGNGISTAATFSTDPPDGTAGVQSTIRANPEFVANPLEAYWFAPAAVLSEVVPGGTIEGDVQFAFALAGNPTQGFGMEVGVWADADSAGGVATKIGAGTIDIAGIGPTPQIFEGTVSVSGVVTTNMIVQLTPQFLNDDPTHVFYDTAEFPSRFEIPVGEPPPAPDLPTSGPVPPPSAGATNLDLASVPTRATPTPADVAAGTGRCAPPVGPNQPPVAVLAASPTSGEEDLVVTFDGSASSDPDGGIATWTLDYGDGSTPTTGTGTPPAAQRHVYFDPGTFTATLTVVDGAGASDAASVVITVTEDTGDPNAAPRAKLSASPRAGKAPLVVHFDGSRSSDPNGRDDLASWTLQFGDGTDPAQGTGPPPADVGHTYTGKGSFTAVLTVTDTAGANHSTSVTIRTK